MKNRLYMTLVLLLVVFCICAPAWADITVGFNPSSQQVPLGSLFSVDLSIAGLGNGAGPAVSTYDIDISYNPAAISLKSVTYGTSLDLFGLGAIQSTTSGSGTVNIFELSLDSAADLNALQPSAFTLAHLYFTTLAMGTSPLNININALGDANGDRLLAVTNPGSVNVVPLPPALFLFAPGLFGLAVVRRKLMK